MLAELPFSSFTAGGTVRSMVDSGRTQTNDKSSGQRTQAHKEKLGQGFLTSELLSTDSRQPPSSRRRHGGPGG